MNFIEQNGQYIIVQCEKCGTNHKKHRTSYKQYGSQYHFNPPIICDCGNVDSIAYMKDESVNDNQINNEEIKCPYCGSTQIQAFNKGFGLGKAVVGGSLLGGVGLLGGFVGSKKVIITCLKCGEKWEVGK